MVYVLHRKLLLETIITMHIAYTYIRRYLNFILLLHFSDTNNKSKNQYR